MMENQIQVQYQGGWYRARFAGRSQSTFGESECEAKERLEYWQGCHGGTTKTLLSKKFSDEG
ncbi:MAG: hypothetical protein WAK56_04755 [Candidatus Sulfotelmatobacter sp.]